MHRHVLCRELNDDDRAFAAPAVVEGTDPASSGNAALIHHEGNSVEEIDLSTECFSEVMRLLGRRRSATPFERRAAETQGHVGLGFNVWQPVTSATARGNQDRSPPGHNGADARRALSTRATTARGERAIPAAAHES